MLVTGFLNGNSHDFRINRGGIIGRIERNGVYIRLIINRRPIKRPAAVAVIYKTCAAGKSRCAETRSHAFGIGSRYAKNQIIAFDNIFISNGRQFRRLITGFNNVNANLFGVGVNAIGGVEGYRVRTGLNIGRRPVESAGAIAVVCETGAFRQCRSRKDGSGAVRISGGNAKIHIDAFGG